MKRIKITEKQAELLGLTNINEGDDTGLKSSSTAIGDAVVRMVISGEAVPKFKDRILQLIQRQDNTAKVGYFEQTGKIVGNVKTIKLDSIKRDISLLDPNIVVEKKPIAKSLKEGSKAKIKLTQEQYDRITKLINESDPKGGLNRIDKSFKKEFAGQNIKLSEGEKSEGEDPFKNEVIELVKYLYRKSDKLSPFWQQNGMTYDSICDTLLSKNMIVKNDNGTYKLAKTLGNPQSALQAVEDTLRAHVKPQVSEPELETEDAGNYPAGAEHDSAAPYNQQDQDTTKPSVAKHPELEPVAFNREICLFKGPDGSLYVFYYENIDKKNFMEYASVPREYIGKDEEGQPEYDYDFDAAEIDANVISHYVNDKLAELTKGEGAEDYEQGVQLVKVDDSLKNELLSLYDKDKNLVNALNPIDEEIDADNAIHLGVNNLMQAQTQPTEKIPQHKVIAKLAELKAREEARRKAEQDAIDAQSAAAEMDEMTGTGSAGAFTGPMGGSAEGDIIKKEMPVPVVAEITAGQGSVGAYDAPGLANVGRNGEFKKGPAPKAFKTSQYPDGQMVKQPACSKLNNNKSAQNGGCNQGASTQKYTKASGSVISPSLAENEIYEAIVKKTGKTLEEVKRIINSKKIKA